MTLSHRLLFAVFGRLAQLLITNCAVRVSCHEFVDTFHCKVLYEEKITYLIDGPVKVFFWQYAMQMNIGTCAPSSVHA